MTDADAQGAQGQGEEGANLKGRARVRAVFIQPLEAAGMVRASGVTVADHGAFLEKLAERLGYLDEGSLRVLCECVLRMGEGKLHNQWPAFVTIWAVAQRVARQPEPDEARHIMTTWLRSRGGPVARAGGYLVELYLFLRARGVPPTEYDLKKIKADAADNARELVRLRGKAERGVASASEVEWVERRLRAVAYCEGLVAGGEAARGEIERGEGAAA